MYSFYKKYFLINLKDYPNLNLDLEINVLLFYFLIGILVSTVIINYRRQKMQSLLRQLVRHEATDEQRARSLREIKFDTKVIRYLLSREGQLTKMVSHVGEKKYTYEEYIALTKSKSLKEEKINFDVARFYIKPDGLDRAKRIIESGNYSLLNTLLLCLLVVAIYICIALLMPAILSFFNNLLG
ncbi:MAG: hypothetical protein IJX92_07070 [Clostridia bacterium]|nr:hypothetical protein [Clostridia bacterium]